MENNIKLTFFDKFLKITLLPFIPDWISPNHVTLFRIIMIPVIILSLTFEFFHLAAILFAIAAFSDAVDGALARVRNQITDIGKIMDPIADKVLVLTVIIMIAPQYIGWPLIVATLVIEFMLVGNAYVVQKRKTEITNAHGTGKIKMVAQSFSILFLFTFIIFSLPLLLTISKVLLLISVIFGATSLFIYRSI